MQSGVPKPPAQPSEPRLIDGAEALSTLSAKLKERARLDAEIVALAGRAQRSGTIEMIEGITLDTYLTLAHRLPAGERGMLLTAADVLADMPATMGLLTDLTVSWGQVRGIVAEARQLSKADRATLDAHIGASAEDLSKMDPDDGVDAVRIAVAELRGARRAERAEDRAEQNNFVWVQFGLFGRGKTYGELDNLSLAQVVGRMDALAPADDGRSLSQRRADGLIALATHDCDDPGATGTGGGVTIIVPLDKNSVDVTAAGVIDVAAPGSLPVITARTVEALAADADVQVVLFDGGRPLTVTKKVRAKTLPKAVRTAVKVRDRGDRFPGSRRPIEHVHHLDRDGEGHHVDHLLGLSGRSHRKVHRNGWHVTVDPGTAEVTFSRGERTWITLPRGSRLRRPQPPA